MLASILPGSYFSTEKKLNCQFEFRLNCKQRVTFEDPISHNRFTSVDAA